jgi:hypothetical protein
MLGDVEVQDAPEVMGDDEQTGTPKVIVGTVKIPSPSQPYEDWQEANRNPRLGNYYFAHDSSGFPIPLRILRCAIGWFVSSTSVLLGPACSYLAASVP